MRNRNHSAAIALLALASWACSPDAYPTESRFEPPPEEITLPDGELFFYIPPAGVTVTSVAVPGEFNGWDPTAASAQMTELADGRWVVGLDLAEGEYQFKYHFNGTTWAGNMCNDATWGDPDNDNKVDPDIVECNGENGIRRVGPPGHNFKYIVPAGVDVEVVTVAGSFQGWNNQTDTLVNIYELTVNLPAGTHQYKYVFNTGGWAGNMCDEGTWGHPDYGNAVDPDNDNCVSGGQDAELTTSGGMHTFRYIVPAGTDSIAQIHVAGSFQGWDPNSAAHVMQETYQRRYDLPDGTYEYKFIFDGNWAGNMCAEATWANGGMVDANGSGTCNGENAVLVMD